MLSVTILGNVKTWLLEVQVSGIRKPDRKKKNGAETEAELQMNKFQFVQEAEYPE